MAVINVVIGIGALGMRVVDILRAPRSQSIALERVLLSVSMVESDAEVVSQKGSVQLVRPSSHNLTASHISTRLGERDALIADYQRGNASRLYKLWKEAEQSIGSGNQVMISVVVEAGADGSGVVLDIAHAARAFVTRDRLRSMRGYVVMPTEKERDKWVPSYATFSEIHRFHASEPLHTNIFHYADETKKNTPEAKYWHRETVHRPFDQWYVMENREGVEQNIAGTIETSLLGDDAMSDTLTTGVNIIAQASLVDNQMVNTAQTVSMRLPVMDVAGLWKVEDILDGMEVLGVHQPDSVIKQMAEAVVFNPFGGNVNFWKRGLNDERQFVTELAQLPGQERLDKLYDLPLNRNDYWRKQEEVLRPVYSDKLPSTDALNQIDGIIRTWYEPEPKKTLDETLTAIAAIGKGGGKFYIDMLHQMYDSAIGSVTRQFEQLTSNAFLRPEEYAQVAERAASTLLRLASVLNKLCVELSQRYTDIRAATLENLKTALKPPTMPDRVKNVIQGVSPVKNAIESVRWLISVARGRHLALVVSAAFTKIADNLGQQATRAQQVNDAILLWREALGRHRRLLIERLGHLIDGAGRVETWALTRKTAQIGDYPKPIWAWGLGILRCNNQNLSLTEPNIPSLLSLMPAYDDAASRLSIVDYLSDSLRTEQVVQWLSKRAFSVYDTLDGIHSSQSGRLYVYSGDNSPNDDKFSVNIAMGLGVELGGNDMVRIIRHPNPSVLTFIVEINGLMPADNLKAVKRAQRAYFSIEPNRVPNVMPGELAILKAYTTLAGKVVGHRGEWAWFTPRALHLADKPDALILFWKGWATKLIRYEAAQEDITALRWVMQISKHDPHRPDENLWMLTPRHHSSADDPTESLLEALESFVLNASVSYNGIRQRKMGRFDEARWVIEDTWLAHSKHVTIPDDLLDDMRGHWQIMDGLRPDKNTRAKVEQMMRQYRTLENLISDLETHTHTSERQHQISSQQKKAYHTEMASVYAMSALLLRAEAKELYDLIKSKIL